MAGRHVLAIDQGTTSTRCIVFDRTARFVSVAQVEHRQFHPRPGWVEHDPAEIWANVGRVVPEALRRAGLSLDDVAALGIANQRETVVAWHRRTGAPLDRAVVWQDVRTADRVERLAADGLADRVRERCGLPLAPYFAGPRMSWLLDAHPGARAAAARGELLLGTMESWLVWNLTGGPSGGRHLTDVTNASRTMLVDLETLDWDDELLAALDVPRAALPEIRPTMDRHGTAVAVAPGVPITAALGDQQAALFGQTCFAPGEAKCTFGTGAFLLLTTGERPAASTHGLITTPAYQLAGRPPVYALEGSIAVAGALVQWFRDNLGLIRSAPEIETLARTVEDNGGCYVVPAFAGLFAPHWRSDARGVVVGLTGYITKGHLARAVLEATAWQTREVVDAMLADSGLALAELKVDGGMTADHLLMQTVADVLGVPVARPMVAETVSLGAAYAAGLAAGLWPDPEVLRRHWHRAGEWLPARSREWREEGYADWQRAVERSLGWVREGRPR
ncbi:glycerol kinase GlpK [Geodermatophilus marinus]|uniref:glycerol kinase GlpK n=1 Tax=Geodermatophilus sp. LHW52908 TaxID=2303986 RepID=UPI000E3DED9B|nr:glycerol kinase GlpK [Geodermatophilus sp. LHW52908]RFU22830.1 glycerol kinase [Geodermatophilus sp. LHW52908]